MRSAQRPSYTLPVVALAVLAGLALYVTLGKRPPPAASQALAPWRSAGEFQIPRRALAAVATHGHLYVIGGVNPQGDYAKTTEYAPLHPDGTLGEWRTTAALNEGRFYLAAVAAGDYIYALGGGGGSLGEENSPVATVERARVLPDGSLGPWEPQRALTTPRRGLKAVAYGQHLYAIGGYNGTFLRSVERAALATDGALGPWQIETEAATVDRYIHSAALHDNALYLLGGHVQKAGTMSYGDVESAALLDDGALAPWRIEPVSLTTPRFIAEAFVLGDTLYMAGGHNGTVRLNSVEMAPILRAGHVGTWSTTAPLLHARSAAAAATWGRHVYVAGGMDADQILNSVEMTTPLSPPP